MIPRPQQPFQDYIQALRDVLGKNHISAVLPVEQAAQQLPGLVDLLFHGIGPAVVPPAHVAAALGEVAVHGLRHSFWFWKRGAPVVQINLPHHRYPLSVGLSISQSSAPGNGLPASNQRISSLYTLSPHRYNGLIPLLCMQGKECT